MQFALTDAEAVEALRNATRGPDGRLLVDLPASRLLEVSADRVDLAFDDAERAVSLGRQRAQLSLTQYRLLKFVWTHGKASFEELQDEVWGKEVSDGAIRAAVSKVNSAIMDAGLPVELLAHKGRVSAEKTA